MANGTRYAYREVDWDEPKETAAMLAANKFAGEWDWEGVSKLLQELNSGGWEAMAMTGFQDHELSNLLNAEWKPPQVSDAPPPGSDAAKMDKVYLNEPARKALNECKARLGETDDAKTIERIALYFVQQQDAKQA